MRNKHLRTTQPTVQMANRVITKVLKKTVSSHIMHLLCAVNMCIV